MRAQFFKFMGGDFRPRGFLKSALLMTAAFLFCMDQTVPAATKGADAYNKGAQTLTNLFYPQGNQKLKPTLDKHASDKLHEAENAFHEALASQNEELQFAALYDHGFAS